METKEERKITESIKQIKEVLGVDLIVILSCSGEDHKLKLRRIMPLSDIDVDEEDEDESPLHLDEGIENLARKDLSSKMDLNYFGWILF